MADGYVTVLWHCNFEESEPLGVFESHKTAVAHIVANYGPFSGMDEINPDDNEIYVHPDRYFCLELVMYRMSLGTARVLNVALDDIRMRSW